MKNFFDLPYPEKQKINKKLSKNARGYFGFAEESLGNAHDLKEGFDLGLNVENPENNPKLKGLDDNYGENIWPDSSLVPNFRAAVEEYFEAIFDLGYVILKAFAMSLNLPPDYFVQFYQSSIPPMPVMRLLRYPPQSQADPDQLGCGVHSDYGFLTILYQDGVGGLEVKNSKGEWIKAVPIENTFVINIGIMLAQLTNDLYSATEHRVINYSPEERFSIPYFFDPEYYATVEPLPSCISESHPKKYGPITFGPNLMKLLGETWEYRKK